MGGQLAAEGGLHVFARHIGARYRTTCSPVLSWQMG